MRLIKTLSENIEEEIDGVREYAKLAIEIRGEYPVIADTLIAIAKQESEHVMKLHELVTRLISDYRAQHGEPPEGMLELYNYLHQKHIDAYAESKRYLDIYNGKVM